MWFISGLVDLKISYMETRDRTTSKQIEKHKGKLTQQSLRPLHGNGMDAISKISKFLEEPFA